MVEMMEGAKCMAQWVFLASTGKWVVVYEDWTLPPVHREALADVRFEPNDAPFAVWAPDDLQGYEWVFLDCSVDFEKTRVAALDETTETLYRVSRGR